MGYYKCLIKDNTKIQDNIFKMEIKCEEMARSAKPGQFVSLYIPSKANLLPRPISICDVIEDTVAFLYQTVGEGTKSLSNLRKGDSVELTGCTGNGFNLDLAEKAENIALVGGGIGVPPLLFLSKKLDKNKTDCFVGFASKILLIDELAQNCNEVFISTEDGSAGFKGNAIELLKKETLKKSDKKYDLIYACGPMPMLSALIAYTKANGIKCQISVEERMACGLGACVGCAFPVKSGEDFVYKKVCVDGPVFDSEEVFLS